MWSPLQRNPIHMREKVSQMQEKPIKKKGLKWMRKETKWVIGKKKFRIFMMKMGMEMRYKLSDNEDGILWTEVRSPGGSSFEVAEDDKYLYFVMCIDGVRRSNIYRQRKG